MLGPYDITGLTGNLHYQVCVKKASDYDAVYTELTTGLWDADRLVEVSHEKRHTLTRSVFILSESEAIALREDVRIKYVVLDKSVYSRNESLSAYWPVPEPDEFRNKKDVKIYCGLQDPTHKPPRGPSVWTDASFTAELGRTHQGVIRPTSVDNWMGYGPGSSPGLNPGPTLGDQMVTLDGSGVDIFVQDWGCFFGHTEFVDPETGRSKVRSVILDGPYYIDPDYFENAGEVRTRWDGLRTCNEDAGRDWWTDSSKRSVAFSGIGTIGYISTSVNYEKLFGTGPQTHGTQDGYHGTACCSQAFGRTLSNAPGAIAWTDHIAFPGAEEEFDVLKMFHNNKPKDESGNTRPTVISTSWSFKAYIPAVTATTVYWGFKNKSTTGSYTNYLNRPEFLQATRNDGPPTSEVPDGGERVRYNFDTRYYTPAEFEAGSELAKTPGVFWFSSAGNEDQYMCTYGDPMYLNYYNEMENDYPSTENNSLTAYVMWGGFPNRAGTTISGSDDIVFSVGNLDATRHVVNYVPGSYPEKKTVSSSSGPSVPFYAPGNDTLAAFYMPMVTNSSQVIYPRADTYEGGYPLSAAGEDGGYCDLDFGGTSAATPVAAGFFACVLQMLFSIKKDLTYLDLQKWIKRHMPALPTEKFYAGLEDGYPGSGETPVDWSYNSANWLLDYQLYGGPARIIAGNFFNNNKTSISGAGLAGVTWSK